MINGSWVRERRLDGRLTMPRIVPRRLRSLHTLLLVLMLVLVGWLGWTWYRSSPLVKVRHVTVIGLAGPDVAQIRDALTAASLQMTTLNMQIGKLEAAVEQYPYVRALSVTRQGAHAVLIDVDERVPVAYAKLGGIERLVDSEGDLLPTTTIVHGSLPSITLTTDPAGSRITGAAARAEIAVFAAAPYALLGRAASATSNSAHGVVVQLRNGPQLYFGPSSVLVRKWNAAVAVLQNSESDGASYIDLTDPARPAAGTEVSSTQAAALGLTSGGSAGG
jgi:cell division protein FtsQ